MRRCLLWLVVVACHHDHPVTPDAPSADAAPDAMVVPSPLAIEDGHASVARWAFPDAVVGHPSAITLFVHNRDAVTTSPLALATDSPEFAIDPASACVGKALGAADFCEVKLRFTPVAAGARSATLHVTGSSVPLDFPLAGSGLPPTPGLEADVDGLDFGTVELGYAETLIIRLSNTSSSQIALGIPTASPDFEVLGSWQSTFISPGEYIEAQVRFTPHHNGPTGGTFAVTSNANDVAVSLAAVGIRRVFLELGGMGNDHVGSVPAGIDCGDGAMACDALFIGPVTLTAQPVAGNQFAGWGLQASAAPPFTWDIPCGNEPTCTLPPDRPVYQNSAPLGVTPVLANFALPDWSPITVSIAGNADGKVAISGADVLTPYFITTCSHDCTTYIPPQYTSAGYASTPHAFAGWQGACGTNRECPYPTGVTSLTATFAKDDHEVSTLLPAFPTDELVWASDGDLVAAGGNVVTKLAPTGEVRWTVALPYSSASSSAIDLVVSSDAIYYLRRDTASFRDPFMLHKLDMAGVPQWSRTFTAKQSCDENPFGHALALGAGGDIAVSLSGDAPSLDVLHSDGTPRWSVALPYQCRNIAAMTDGTYLVLVADTTFTSSQVHRYAADGTPLSSFATIPGSYVGLAVSPGGDVAMQWNGAATSTMTDVTVARFHSDGTPVFQRTVSEPNFTTTNGIADGVAFDSADHLIAVRALDASIYDGSHLERWSPAGASEWATTKLRAQYANPMTKEELFEVRAVATDATGRVAIAGRYNDAPWIEIFTPP